MRTDLDEVAEVFVSDLGARASRREIRAQTEIQIGDHSHPPHRVLKVSSRNAVQNVGFDPVVEDPAANSRFLE